MPETIRSLRKKSGLKQMDLCARAGISKPTLIRMEKNTGPVMRSAFLCVCVALGVRPEDIDGIQLRG